MFRISPSEKASLEAKLKKAREASERNRLCVILGHDEGLSIDALAKAFRISHATVCNYLKDYELEQKIDHDPKGGGRLKLSPEQSDSLLQHLSEITYLKVKEIRAYVEKQYGITYSRSGMTAWLQDHGFVYKRPKKIPGKLDLQKQAIFIEEYAGLKANLKPNEEIYFVDAVHPEHQSQATCGWMKKGTQKTLQTTGKQLRLHVAGAVCLAGMKFFTQEYETIDADAMIDFFRNLEKSSNASTIYVILDNARSNKNKKLEEFLKTSKIKMSYLPPYSPNLNPIERLWKIMRETKLYNRYFEKSVDFFREVRSFFKEDIPRMASKWSSRINDKFETVKLNPIRLAV